MQRRVTDEEMLKTKFRWLQPLEKIIKRNRTQQIIWWKCQCDCGNLVERRESSLVGHNAESCGCMNRSHIHGSSHPHFRGCGELSAAYFSEIKHGAKTRGISFDITIEAIWELFLKQASKCALTGLSLVFSTQRQQQAGVEQTASLDRIDSNKGYTMDNVQWVHKIVNAMKKEYGQERYIEVCHLVAAKNPRPQAVAA